MYEILSFFFEKINILWFFSNSMSINVCVESLIFIQNQINDNASERMGLRASFERYRRNTSWLITLLHIIKVTRFWIFFSKKLAYSRILWIFLKATVHKWARRGINNFPNDINGRALKKRGLGASFKVYNGSTSCLSTVLSSFKEECL